MQGFFFPPWWGGNGNLKIISPPYFETLGGKFGLFPPHISRPWGGNSVISPHVGGKSGRRRRKILRIWRSEMLNFLYKNVFQRLKSLKFSACGGLFSCLDSFTKYIVVTETLKNFACGELLYVFLSLVCHASSVQIVL